MDKSLYWFQSTKFIYLMVIFIWCTNIVNSYCDSHHLDDYSERTMLYKLKNDQQKKVIENQILNLFGLKHKPNITNERYKRKLNSNYLNSIYNQYNVFKDDNLISNNLKQTKDNKFNLSNFQAIEESDVIISFDSQISYSISNRTKQFFRFNISKALIYENVIRSELVFYQNRLNLTNKDIRYNIQINVKTESHYVTLNYELNKLIQIEEDNWIKIDFTTIFKEIIYDEQQEFRIDFNLFLMKDDRLISWPVTDFVNEFRKPLLVSYFKSNINLHELNRIKRDLNSHTEASKLANYRRFSRRKCQLNSFLISFQELGWEDWIIAPQYYSSFFCSGQCSFPLKESTNSTNHAIIQSLMQLLNPKNIPKPCCSAIKLASIELLYLDEDKNVTWKKISNMVPKSCGC